MKIFCALGGKRVTSKHMVIQVVVYQNYLLPGLILQETWLTRTEILTPFLPAHLSSYL